VYVVYSPCQPRRRRINGDDVPISRADAILTLAGAVSNLPGGGLLYTLGDWAASSGFSPLEDGADAEVTTMKLRGIVREGEGSASFWLGKYAAVYRLWTGMAIVPGSLNVHLAAKFDWDDPRVEPFKRIYSLAPYGGNRDVCLIPCEVYREGTGKVYGFAWATTYAAADLDYRVLEIIAPVRLREVLRLTDGSVLTVDIPVAWKE
jgi:CTP-dependent riboflavin kinase